MSTSTRPAHRARRVVACLVALLAFAAVLTACGSSAQPDASATAQITIRNFMFEPSTLTVKAGTTITVKNADDTQHTITADDKSFDTGPIDGGKSATFTVTTVGTGKFHCNIHNYMTGAIQVTR